MLQETIERLEARLMLFAGQLDVTFNGTGISSPVTEHGTGRLQFRYPAILCQST